MHPRKKAEIKRDLRGYDRVELPRKEGDRWVVQASMFLAQGWRANCDLQILLCDSDPDNPLPEDVGRVTDYIVACQCKGNETCYQERKKDDRPDSACKRERWQQRRCEDIG
jgi:hypothetical protein